MELRWCEKSTCRNKNVGGISRHAGDPDKMAQDKVQGCLYGSLASTQKESAPARSYSTQEMPHQEGREPLTTLQHSSSPFTLQTQKKIKTASKESYFVLTG